MGQDGCQLGRRAETSRSYPSPEQPARRHLLRRLQLRLRRRVGRNFKVFTNVYGAVIDPKKFDPKSFVDIEGDYCLIPPNSFALAETVEYFEIPRNVSGHLPGQIDLRPLRHHRQRHAAGAGMARQDHHRNQQHHAAAGQDLRQRGHRPDSLFRTEGRARRAMRTRRGSTRTKRG